MKFLPLLVLAATCSTTMASGLESRNRNTVRQPERALSGGLRVASAKTNKEERDRRLEKRSIRPQRTQTRGAQKTLQNRRQLGKDGGKNGGKNGGKTGGKNGGKNGSGKSGSRGSYGDADAYSYQNDVNRTGAGYTDDGVYIGCLSDTYQALGFSSVNGNLDCDYAVEEESYGFNVT